MRDSATPPNARRRDVILAASCGVFVAGMVGTVLPAFGYLPAIGGHSISIEPWQRLFAYPGIATSIVTSVSTGFAATLLSLALAIAFCGVAYGHAFARRIGGLVAPILSTPHAAIAIGVAFLIAPSGWIARVLSPWLTGWTLPLTSSSRMIESGNLS